MTQINTDLLTLVSIEYQKKKKEYDEIKRDMDENTPTAERLKKLILVTSQLAKIRRKMHENSPQA